MFAFLINTLQSSSGIGWATLSCCSFFLGARPLFRAGTENDEGCYQNINQMECEIHYGFITPPTICSVAASFFFFFTSHFSLTTVLYLHTKTKVPQNNRMVQLHCNSLPLITARNGKMPDFLDIKRIFTHIPQRCLKIFTPETENYGTKNTFCFKERTNSYMQTTMAI